MTSHKNNPNNDANIVTSRRMPECVNGSAPLDFEFIFAEIEMLKLNDLGSNLGSVKRCKLT